MVIKRLTRRYQVGQGDVTLRIAVGDGQVGTSLVQLGDRDLASGNVAMISLGSGGDLDGQTARVITMVTDVMRATNHTSMRYVLAGGPAPATFDAEEDVDKDGGTVRYIARFRFGK